MARRIAALAAGCPSRRCQAKPTNPDFPPSRRPLTRTMSVLAHKLEKGRRIAPLPSPSSFFRAARFRTFRSGAACLESFAFF
jgi:hypothetical protein